jgi:hypothetical protein
MEEGGVRPTAANVDADDLDKEAEEDDDVATSSLSAPSCRLRPAKTTDAMRRERFGANE